MSNRNFCTNEKGQVDLKAYLFTSVHSNCYFKKKTLYHSLGIEMPLKISFSSLIKVGKMFLWHIAFCKLLGIFL